MFCALAQANNSSYLFFMGLGWLLPHWCIWPTHWHLTDYTITEYIINHRWWFRLFRGEIHTPILDKLATLGIKFTNFHTLPTCSPTRSVLLTGTDNHIAGVGGQAPVGVTEYQQQHPGYEGYLNHRVATLPAVLQNAGTEASRKVLRYYRVEQATTLTKKPSIRTKALPMLETDKSSSSYHPIFILQKIIRILF